jgi:hypothetical protein
MMHTVLLFALCLATSLVILAAAVGAGVFLSLTYVRDILRDGVEKEVHDKEYQVGFRKRVIQTIQASRAEMTHAGETAAMADAMPDAAALRSVGL